MVERLGLGDVMMEDTDAYGLAPLLHAVKANGTARVKRFLVAGAHIHHTTTYGDTALTMACYEGFEDIVELLLEHGADVNRSDEHGVTPLMCATANGHMELVRTLLLAGANPHYKTTNNLLGAFDLALVHSYGDIACVLLPLLIDRPDKEDDEEMGCWRLVRACSLGLNDVVDVLIVEGRTSIVAILTATLHSGVLFAQGMFPS